ncbi:ferredoxin [Streptomyces sp. NPDC048251]|uniref:ferredoxin n=1 Tax=Streptomyces sp. NPDC048251 TaxID=3154501 RepID=UPI003438F72E
MKVTIDEDRCIGTGQCVAAAAAVFDQRDDGIVVLLTENPAAERAEEVRHAATVCPALAIHVAE